MRSSYAPLVSSSWWWSRRHPDILFYSRVTFPRSSGSIRKQLSHTILSLICGPTIDTVIITITTLIDVSSRRKHHSVREIQVNFWQYWSQSTAWVLAWLMCETHVRPVCFVLLPPVSSEQWADPARPAGLSAGSPDVSSWKAVKWEPSQLHRHNTNNTFPRGHHNSSTSPVCERQHD